MSPFKMKAVGGGDAGEDCRWREIPLGYVAADSIYGSSSELEAVERSLGVTHIVAFPRDTLYWLQEQAIMEKISTDTAGRRGENGFSQKLGRSRSPLRRSPGNE